MFNLLQLFLRLSGFFVFLLLEIICFTLIVKYNQQQNTIYSNSTNLFSGFLLSKSAATGEYFNLKKENKRLAVENARLLERLYEVDKDTLPKKGTVHSDSLGPHYTFVAAKVIKNSINNNQNYLVLDKGSRDGIGPHSGVMVENGVIGIVRKVSNSYSIVMSVLHRQMNISARIRGKFYFGSLAWKESDIHLFSLEDVPKHAPIVKGDTVETSGYSAIFPEGIPLGVVDKVWMEPGSNFYTIEVRANVDMSNIRYAYVVTNLLKTEQEKLEQALSKENE